MEYTMEEKQEMIWWPSVLLKKRFIENYKSGISFILKLDGKFGEIRKQKWFIS